MAKLEAEKIWTMEMQYTVSQGKIFDHIDVVLEKNRIFLNLSFRINRIFSTKFPSN